MQSLLELIRRRRNEQRESVTQKWAEYRNILKRRNHPQKGDPDRCLALAAELGSDPEKDAVVLGQVEDLRRQADAIDELRAVKAEAAANVTRLNGQARVIQEQAFTEMRKGEAAATQLLQAIESVNELERLAKRYPDLLADGD